MKRKWFSVFSAVVWIIGVADVSSAYMVDKNFLYQEESVYESSKFNLDYSYDKSFFTFSEDDRTNAEESSSLETSIGAIRKVERSIYGYWFDTAFEYTQENNEETIETSISSITTKENLDIYKLKEFEGAYEGFLLYDYADAGIKRYLSEQSPYYFFGQSLFYWEKIESDSDTSTSIYGSEEMESDNPEILVGGGIGYGKIVDLGSYERVLVVQDELLDTGILKNKLSRSTILRLLPLFRRKSDEYDRLRKVQAILEEEGLIDKQQLTLDVATDLIDAIDEAFEKREYGFEARLGYLQDVVHQDSDEEKAGRIYAYLKYEKPLTPTHQYTVRSDFFHVVSYDSDDDNVVSGTELQVKNYISSVWLTNLESVFGVDLIYKDDLSNEYIERMAMRSDVTVDAEDDLLSEFYYFYYPEGISAKLYGILEFEITDYLTWENGVNYTFVRPYNSSYDSKEYLEVLSTFSIEIW